MRNKEKWITDTERVVAQHKASMKPMTYVLPVNDDARCATCTRPMITGSEKMHELRETGVVHIYCSDECWMRQPVIYK